MEWGLSEGTAIPPYLKLGLNPCSNGMGIEQIVLHQSLENQTCLNPCSNGMGIEPGLPSLMD